MKKYLTAMALAALSTTAFASGTHEGGHDKVSLAGEPGKKAKVTQTIQVTMKETEDGKMLYMPASVKVKLRSSWM